MATLIEQIAEATLAELGQRVLEPYPQMPLCYRIRGEREFVDLEFDTSYLTVRFCHCDQELDTGYIAEYADPTYIDTLKLRVHEFFNN